MDRKGTDVLGVQNSLLNFRETFLYKIRFDRYVLNYKFLISELCRHLKLENHNKVEIEILRSLVTSKV